ncbi:DUF4262 domain-containing protein [Gynuella sp.]|uniref:DUF4262 domain-containing protein n=1 Tax=Gynuella sp. TaxID=2969146 RepID=UPI003D0D5C31
MDDKEENALNDIKEYGCHVLSILEEDNLPGFSYSIGIEKSEGEPEVIVYGLKPEIRQYLVNEYNHRIKAGERFIPGRFYSGFLGDFDVTFIEVSEQHYREHFGWANWLYHGNEFKVLQMIWPTTTGVWPWDAETSDDYNWAQPILNDTGSLTKIT